jgi:hypothetical protein
MIEQISQYFSIEMIYLWLNIGVLPFWFILIFFSYTNICKYLVTSIIPILIFTFIYIYLIILFYKSNYNFIENFNLYIGLNELQNLMNDSSFLIAFWVHFLAINLFCGSWIVKDSQKYAISKFLVFLPIVVTYFVGPLGLVLYWLIRIFFAKKIDLYN